MTQEKVREEHLQAVHQDRHWLYLFGVIGGGFLLMVAIIAVLGAGGS